MQQREPVERGVRIDIPKGGAWVDGAFVALTRLELRALNLLVQRSPHLVEKREMIGEVWPEWADAATTGGKVYADLSASLDSLIHRLRKKIESEPHYRQHIETRRGQGFLLRQTASLDRPPGSQSVEQRELDAGKDGSDNPLVQAFLYQQDGAQAEATYVLRKETAIIGRALDCDIVIITSTMSRKHATVTHDGGQYVLTDHSTHGTRVNGERLHSPVLLQTGDTVQLGGVTLIFNSGDATSL